MRGHDVHLRKGAKMCFVFFLSCHQCGFSATYHAPILTIFWCESVFTCIHQWKISEFLCRVFWAPKTAKKGTAQTAQFRAMGIILVAMTTQRCAFCTRVYVRMYSLPVISPWKTPLSMICAVFFMITVHVSMSLAKWQHALVQPICQWVSDPLQPV